GVRRARNMELLRYSFYPAAGGYRLRIPPKSLQRMKGTLREITSKTWSVSMSQRLKRLTEVCRGWMAYFKLADAKNNLQRIDEWVRSRLRYCIWTQWKRVRTRYKALRKLGASHRNAYIWANTRKGGWHVAHSYVLTGTVTNARLEEGLQELDGLLFELNYIITVMNRRIPDRYVRWCERTVGELITYFLLDWKFYGVINALLVHGCLFKGDALQYVTHLSSILFI